MARLALSMVLLAAACTPQPGTERIGPLRIDVPSGWQTTREGRNSIKFTDGTVAGVDSTRAGSATAVFDLYLNSQHTPASYRALVADQKGTVLAETTTTVDGETVTILDIEGESFAGRRTIVIVDARDVLVVYRAAYPNDEDAFLQGRPALLEAVRSFEFDELAA